MGLTGDSLALPSFRMFASQTPPPFNSPTSSLCMVAMAIGSDSSMAESRCQHTKGCVGRSDATQDCTHVHFPNRHMIKGMHAVHPIWLENVCSS